MPMATYCGQRHPRIPGTFAAAQVDSWQVGTLAAGMPGHGSAAGLGCNDYPARAT